MARQKTLLEGNITSQLVTLALPLLIGNILQQMYNMISAVIVERYLGEVAFAAVGIAGTVMNLFIFILGGCCAGIAVVTASLYGKQDYAVLRQGIFLSAVLGISFTLVLSLLGLAFMPFILQAIQTPAEISALAVEYLNVIFIGLIASFFYNFFAAIMRAVGNTRAALFFLIISIISSLLLTLLFVDKLQMGVMGAALSTVLSQFLSAVLCLIYIRKNLHYLRVYREDMHYNSLLVSQISRYSLVSALHQSSLYIGKLLVQGAVNTMGLSAISAFTATTRIEGLVQAFGDCGGESISVFVAQNTGAGKKKRARQGFKIGLVILILVNVVLSIILFLGAGQFMRLMISSNSQLTIQYGASYLQILSFFYFLSFMGYSFVGYYRGSGRVNLPFIGTTLQIVIRVVLSYLLVSSMGMDAVAYATGIGWIAIVIFHSLAYRKIRKAEMQAEAEEEKDVC